MASFRVKQGVWRNPPTSAFLQVKSFSLSFLMGHGPVASVATRFHSLPCLPNSLVGGLTYLASLRVTWEGKVRA